MRILHVVPSYLPAWRYGGPIRSVHGLCRALAAVGHEVVVATTNADGPGRLDVPLGAPVDRDGVAVRYFPLGFPARLYRSPELLAWARREIERFDVVHLHSVFLWPTSAVARVAERAGVPYIVSPRGMLVDHLIEARGRLRKRAWIVLCERRTLADAAAIHVTSASEAGDLRGLGLDLAPVAVVENGVALQADEEPTGLGDADRVATVLAAGPYLLALGRMAAKKRLELAIEAIAGVAGLRLVIAGNDEERRTPELAGLARRLGAEDRVTFLGEVRGEPKWALLSGAAALALPSASENFGNVVLESLAAGRPTLVSRRVGAAEVVARAGAGWVLDDDSEEWRRAIGELLDDPAAAAAMGRRGRETVERELSWERIAARMLTVYEGAMARIRGEAA